MAQQGWDDVTILRKKVPQKKPSPNEGEKKQSTSVGYNGLKKTGQVNKNKEGIDSRHAIKVDNETEEFKIKTLGIATGKAIQKARSDKKLTQKELAEKINERVNTVIECESGKLVANNQQVLAKMERILGVYLRGKNIGAPLVMPSAKKKQ